MTLTIAVIGAGPAGLYLADELLRQDSLDVRIDLFDRLPAPFGLLRYGVAPDHLKMKALAVPLQRTLDDDRVRFFGNVHVGLDVTVQDLREHYSAVVYTYGASADRELGIPGEGIVGSTSAAEFVSWYSGHPDSQTSGSVLAAQAAVVVGAGNVAIDVTRMLVKSADELATTDIPDSVLDALRGSQIRDVHVVVRRGPAHVKFTSKELRELGQLDGVDVVVAPEALELTPQDQALIDSDRALGRSVAILQEWASRQLTGADRRIHFHFWTSPRELTGDDTLAEVVVAPTNNPGEPRSLTAQLVVRCVGYRGHRLPGVPFDDASGTIPTRAGRVLRNNQVSQGEYAAGWISRGPVGVLGTNRANAAEVVGEMLVDDLPDADEWDVAAELASRGVDVVALGGWAAIDRLESDRGNERGVARTKISTWEELLEAARSAGVELVPTDDAMGAGNE